MICADGNKRQKTSYREFIPVQSRSLFEIVGGVGIARRIEVAFCGIGDRLLLGAYKYAHSGRGGSRRVASAENGAPGDCADGRRVANAGRRSVRRLLAAVPGLPARISPRYRNGSRSRSDSRVVCFETYLGVPDRSGSGPRETPPRWVRDYDNGTAVGRGHEKGTIL